MWIFLVIGMYYFIEQCGCGQKFGGFPRGYGSNVQIVIEVHFFFEIFKILSWNGN